MSRGYRFCGALARTGIGISLAAAMAAPARGTELTDWRRLPAAEIRCGHPYRLVFDLPGGYHPLQGKLCLRITQPEAASAPALELVWPRSGSMTTDAGRVRDVTVRRLRSGWRIEWLFELLSGWTDGGVLRFDVGRTGEPARATLRGPPFRAAYLPPDRWTVIVHGKSLSEGRLGGLLGKPARAWQNEEQTGEYLAMTQPEGQGAWGWSIARRLQRANATPVRLHRMRRSTHVLETWDAAADAYLEDPAAAAADACHHVLFFDWDQPSNYLAPYAGIDNGYAYAAGDALYALLESHALTERVMAFVGHSRGAVVVSEAARRMVRRGVRGFQCLYLDGEGWGAGMPALGIAGYADSGFHGWAGTRADQYRQACDAAGLGSLKGLGAAVTHTGGQPLADGNDIALWRWPQGTSINGRPSGGRLLDHMNFPEFFADWACVADEPSGRMAAHGGLCLEMPVIVSAGPRVYPRREPGLPPGDTGGLYNGELAYGSLAGWVYHGGTPAAWARAWNLVALAAGGRHVLPLTSAQPEVRHNWTALTRRVVNLRFELAWLMTAASELVILWEDEELGRLALSERQGDWTGVRLPVDLPAGSVGRLAFRLDAPDDGMARYVLVARVGLEVEGGR